MSHPNLANIIEHVPYRSVRDSIRNGDLLLWEPTNLFGRLISRKTHGPYSHVGSASWAGDVLESHDMLQWNGGMTRNLSTLVRKFPGKAHVYRVPHLNRQHFFSQLQRRRAGEDYGWNDLFWATIFNDFGFVSPSKRRLKDVDRDKESEAWTDLYHVPVTQPAFCSQGVASDLRNAGVRVYPELAAWEISPNMLAAISEYRFTLIT
jgi:hypothetical protein